MRRDIVLSGFVLTADEWDGLDALARAQLMRAGGPTDVPFLPPIPPPPRRLRNAPHGSAPPASSEPDLSAGSTDGEPAPL